MLFLYFSACFASSMGRDLRFGSKVIQIGPRKEKSGTFSDLISVHFGAGRWSEMSRICSILDQSDPPWSQTRHPWLWTCYFRKFLFIFVRSARKLSVFVSHRQIQFRMVECLTFQYEFLILCTVILCTVILYYARSYYAWSMPKHDKWERRPFHFEKQ